MKLIKTNDYLLLVDEEAKIKQNDYLFDELTSHYAGIHQHSEVEYENKDKPNIIQCISGTTCPISCSSKVIAYYPLNSEAKELDIPLLPDSFRHNDITDMLYHLCRATYGNEFEEWIEAKEYHKHKAAQSKQFSLEDMMKAYTQGSNDSYDSCYISNTNPCGAEVVEFNQSEFDKLTEKYFQSLSTQRLPKNFIPEMIVKGKGDLFENVKPEPKVIVNADGKEELVGTYNY